MRGPSKLSSPAFTLLATMILAGAAGTAAGDAGTGEYVFTQTTGLYEPPPANAVAVASATVSTSWIGLPFEFPYFGVYYDHVTANRYGFVTFGNDPATSAASSAPVSIGSPAVGACAPLMCILVTAALTKTYTWTAGVAPARRFIVSYENVSLFGTTDLFTFQLKLYEDTGVIEFAYKPDTVAAPWPTFTHYRYLDAPGSDPRWAAPVTGGQFTGARPPDCRAVPVPIAFTGRLLYDRLTPAASGLGSATTAVPLRFAGLDVLLDDGRRAGRGRTDGSGNFSIAMIASPAGSIASLYAVSETPACTVKAPGAPAEPRMLAAAGIDTAGSVDVGTRTLTVAADPSAAFRGAACVAGAVQRASELVSAATGMTIPQISVSYDRTSAASTSYNAAGSIVVAGPGASNDDTWDDAVVIRTYGRHVLSRFAPLQLTSFDDRFDAVTTPANAFAVAFGHLLSALTLGQAIWIDSTGVSSAVAFDLEDPEPSSQKGGDVAGWVAGALYDLADPANEPINLVEGGSGGLKRVLDTIDPMTSAPDGASFLASWQALGFDALGVSRLFVANGLVADDGSEPNDLSSEATAMGGLGGRRTGLVLGVGNEDWFEFTTTQAAIQVTAELDVAGLSSPATLEFQALRENGAVIGGKVDAGGAPVVLALGDLVAGTYRLRVRHVGGGRIPAYALQASSRVSIDHTPLPPWTEGVVYDRTLVVDGGVGSHNVSVDSGTLPPGLQVNASTGRVFGTPSQPGAYAFTLLVADSGDPRHTDSTSHNVVIAEALAFDFGEFVPFALGKAVNVTRVHTGGTPPLTASLASGALPAGLSLAADDVRFSGTPTVAGATPISVHAVDTPGSADDADAVAVVCVGLAGGASTADLAAGDSACGFFFDAVAGSKASVKIGTVSKQPKRALRVVLLGPDGLPVPGAVLKGGNGKATLAVASVPQTGRYFAIAASGAGDATQLTGSAGIAPPKKGKGAVTDVPGGGSTEIRFGALAGAKVSFKAQAAKGSEQTLTYLALIGPDNVALPLAGLTSAKGTSILLAATLPSSGTWTVRIRATGGNAGTVNYSFGIGQPKGVTYTQD